VIDKRLFLHAMCPICNKDYIYLVQFKPVTCQRLECVYEADKRGLIYKEKVQE
jgi:hypothetical protein